MRRTALQLAVGGATAIATAIQPMAAIVPAPALAAADTTAGGSSPAGSVAPAPADLLATAASCGRTITANVVALDQTIVFNRLGATNPAGMIYALRRDVEGKNGSTALTPGNVELRPDRRPRPLTLRMNVGDCLQVNLQNLLNPTPLAEQPVTRSVGLHVMGMQLVNSIADDGSNVGANASSLVAPGGTATYTFYAEREGTNLLYSPVDNVSAEGIGTAAFGLFGAVNVEPKGSEWYRSQVTRQDMDLATTGYTTDGHPIINYDATYPAGLPLAGLPILNLLQGSEIVHADLTAIITGPGRGRFGQGGSPSYPTNPAYPDRNEPFREFTLVFHDEVKVTQAFPVFDVGNDVQNPLKFALKPVQDAKGINYGIGGIGPEILANRLGVGPMWDCPECKFEEFFLSSWAIGDVASIVDVPANAKDASGNLILGPKANKALYPDDPSNVYHTYIGDHTKFRNLHVGKEHHIFHLHSHQWLFTPDDDNSTYLDSQAIGPGTGYTYEIAYNGSGNRNKTPGDAIFHCHFYPHFAQGMWALWRSHDVFERGTELDASGTPVPGARAEPDGEIMAGTPIPALVPIPTLPMAPMPEAQVAIVAGPLHPVPGSNGTVLKPAGGQVQVLGTGNPGYPFFVPGQGGHRPPTPALDMTNPADMTKPADQRTVYDGGLPRHVITGAVPTSTSPSGVKHQETPLDFSKELVSVSAQFIPEDGSPVEKAAMAYHATRLHATFTPDGTPAQYELNGLPAAPGAPYAEPCRDDSGNAIATNRIYKAAGIQFDMKINKAGWHFPQARILTLWDDVSPTLAGTRPPEPFVMRVNSGDCINYYHTNLLPNVYQQDAYQVRTPTDVIGQHIHLVKFDVTSSDGSGNGFNYEDGTMSPDEVRERINAIRAGNVCSGTVTNCSTLAAKPHPFFGSGPNNAYLGARTSIQRWYADPLVNNAGLDRTLGTVFTHDHFGPSSHQQTGLYSTLLVEPRGSQWRHPETGVLFGTKQNSDGGPTSWRADILTTTNATIAASNFDKESHREFFFEFADFQHAYEAGHGVDASGKPIPDARYAINPSGLKEVGLPDILQKPVPVTGTCPNGTIFDLNGCPQAISAEDVGTFTVNYRNEPLALRVRDPATNSQAAGSAGDLSSAFSSTVTRADQRLNKPGPYPPLTQDVGSMDPFTPLVRVYDGDKVRIRVQVGATEEGHMFSMHGLKWQQEYASPNSGWRNSQMLGISEQFIVDTPIVGAKTQAGNSADYLYSVSSSVDGLWNGNWGLLRSYGKMQSNLLALPNNPITSSGLSIPNAGDFNGMCPKSAPVRTINIAAVAARDVLPGGTLIYNSRTVNGGPLHDPTAILYVRTQDLVLDPITGQAKGLKPGTPVEPLILRANAGDCVKVILTNKLPAQLMDLDGFNTLPPIVDGFNANDIHPSTQIGLRPQLMAYDVTKDEGSNVGANPAQTLAPGAAGRTQQYLWYAGDVRVSGGKLVATPVEFGATNLISSDPIKHSSKGAIGALIVEPPGATWVEDASSRASATVTKTDGSTFRDFVLLFQDDLNLRLGGGTTAGSGTPVPTVAGEEDSEDSGMKALNYRTEPLWLRLGIDPAAPPGGHGGSDSIEQHNFTNALANSLVGGDPQTPIFTATARQAIRLRVLQPGGHTRNHVFVLHGHTWQREPYVNGSTQIGDNPLSEWHGSQEGHGPTDHWDIVPAHGAGGAFGVTGDYLIRDFAPLNFYNGVWGILRVQ